jgi:hypothetical protein
MDTPNPQRARFQRLFKQLVQHHQETVALMAEAADNSPTTYGQ